MGSIERCRLRCVSLCHRLNVSVLSTLIFTWATLVESHLVFEFYVATEVWSRATFAGSTIATWSAQHGYKIFKHFTKERADRGLGVADGDKETPLKHSTLSSVCGEISIINTIFPRWCFSRMTTAAWRDGEGGKWLSRDARRRQLAQRVEAS